MLDEIFSRFTEENRDNLLRTAQALLKVQREDAEMIAVASAPAFEEERVEMA